MKVSELIAFLKKQPKDLQVAYSLYSEQCLLEARQIKVVTLCKARPDGWIENLRPDKEIDAENYLMFPGN